MPRIATRGAAQLSRRHALQQFALYTAATASLTNVQTTRAAPEREASDDHALVAITLDLEMSRNFPRWEDTHWDYEKGNLDDTAKRYSLEACRRVKQRGGLIHTFVLGSTLEQANVEWLQEIAAEGHPIGNHTYDHVNLLARERGEIQFRFQRAPWLVAEREIADILRENIVMTNHAIRERLNVAVAGFRTPGGFAQGLTGRDDIQSILLGLGFDWISCRYPTHAGVVNLMNPNERPSAAAFDAIVSAQLESQPFRYPSGLWDIPMSPISDINAFRNGRWRLDYFLEAIELALQWVIEHRAVFDFLAHPSCLGVVDPHYKAIDRICELVENSRGAAKLATLEQVAQRATERTPASSDEPVTPFR